jgi:hypothetical protein
MDAVSSGGLLLDFLTRSLASLVSGISFGMPRYPSDKSDRAIPVAGTEESEAGTSPERSEKSMEPGPKGELCMYSRMN